MDTEVRVSKAQSYVNKLIEKGRVVQDEDRRFLMALLNNDKQLFIQAFNQDWEFFYYYKLQDYNYHQHNKYVWGKQQAEQTPHVPTGENREPVKKALQLDFLVSPSEKKQEVKRERMNFNIPEDCPF